MKIVKSAVTTLLSLAVLLSCQKEEQFTSATIDGTWVFSSQYNGYQWTDLKVSDIYCFDGKGGYTVKSLPETMEGVTYYKGKVYTLESSFSKTNPKKYTAKIGAAKNYVFESLPGTYTLTNETSDVLTFDYTGIASAKGFMLSKVSEFETASDPSKPEDGKKSINGTSISEGNDLVGLITDKKTGRGIPGVTVTDGYDCVKTDANGVYQFKSNSLTRFVYYTTPAEYKISTPTSPSQPVFYKAVSPDGKVLRTDFVLEPLPGGKETNWTFVGIGDPQCCKAAEANRYSSETIPDLKKATAGLSSVYAMTLGDIVFDSTNMWPTMKAAMSSVYNGTSFVVFFQTIGNHDHDSLKPDTADNLADDYNATSTFGSYFGPTDYSFDRGDVHVVSMDDIPVTSLNSSSKSNGKTWEYGKGFTDAQYQWLKKDLDMVADKENKMVFICCHIPFRGATANHMLDVVKLMMNFKEAHIMIGHTHYTQNYVYGSSYKAKGGLPVYEHIHGSACGAWWTSTSSSTVTGEPSGYTIYDIEGAHIKDWKFKGTNKDADFQLRVFDGNAVYYQAMSYPLNWYTASQKAGTGAVTVKGNSNLKNCFVAQVFNDDDTYWTVELRKKSTGEKIGNFKRLSNGSSTNVAMSAFYFNKKVKNSSSYSSTTASHYWYYKPASGDPASESDWVVVATHKLPGGTASHEYTCEKISTESSFEKEFYF